MLTTNLLIAAFIITITKASQCLSQGLRKDLVLKLTNISNSNLVRINLSISNQIPWVWVKGQIQIWMTHFKMMIYQLPKIMAKVMQIQLCFQVLTKVLPLSTTSSCNKRTNSCIIPSARRLFNIVVFKAVDIRMLIGLRPLSEIRWPWVIIWRLLRSRTHILWDNTRSHIMIQWNSTISIDKQMRVKIYWHKVMISHNKPFLNLSKIQAIH